MGALIIRSVGSTNQCGYCTRGTVHPFGASGQFISFPEQRQHHGIIARGNFPKLIQNLTPFTLLSVPLNICFLETLLRWLQETLLGLLYGGF